MNHSNNMFKHLMNLVNVKNIKICKGYFWKKYARETKETIYIFGCAICFFSLFRKEKKHDRFFKNLANFESKFFNLSNTNMK